MPFWKQFKHSVVRKFFQASLIYYYYYLLLFIYQLRILFEGKFIIYKISSIKGKNNEENVPFQCFRWNFLDVFYFYSNMLKALQYRHIPIFMHNMCLHSAYLDVPLVHFLELKNRFVHEFQPSRLSHLFCREVAVPARSVPVTCTIFLINILLVLFIIKWGEKIQTMKNINYLRN